MTGAQRPTNAPAPPLADFAGCWHLHRTIRPDGTAPGQMPARLQGEAVWRPAPRGLVCTESGLLHLPGQAPLRAERRYLWQDGPDGISVRFGDGRFFHRIPASGGPVAHDCPPDRYDGGFDFSGWPDLFRVVWRVHGPRKGYRMDSLYRRPPGLSPAG